MFKLTVGLIVVLVALPAAATPNSPKERQVLGDSCQPRYTRADFHRVAHRVFDGKHPATRFERTTLRKVVRCQTAPRKSRPIIRRHRERYRNLHLYRLEVDRLTPYGRWAIPGYIVACESHGSWSAYNPSGALGPYQLLGKGAPFPADTRAKRLTHHRIAGALWNGGAGASHWVCT